MTPLGARPDGECVQVLTFQPARSAGDRIAGRNDWNGFPCNSVFGKMNEYALWHRMVVVLPERPQQICACKVSAEFSVKFCGRGEVVGPAIGSGSGCSGVRRGGSPIPDRGRPRTPPSEYARRHVAGPPPERICPEVISI